jgi:hypothetical protein
LRDLRASGARVLTRPGVALLQAIACRKNGGEQQRPNQLVHVPSPVIQREPTVQQDRDKSSVSSPTYAEWMSTAGPAIGRAGRAKPGFGG